MVRTQRVVIEQIGYALGNGDKGLWDLTEASLARLDLPSPSAIGGVIAATFSNPYRFPSLAVRVATKLGLSKALPAFDLQLACSSYPYAIYLAKGLATDTGKKILVVNGDCQQALVDKADHATGGIFSDAITASIVSVDKDGESAFDFLSCYNTALTCSATGPIQMDGMKVFIFVATEVREFLKNFLSSAAIPDLEFFVPHQAQPYMIRQLAKSIGLESRLVTLDESIKNPGGCSIPLAIATRGVKGVALITGFGAGYSAAVGTVKVL